MIISLSGKLNSGKDLVADIIRYLFYKKYVTLDYSEQKILTLEEFQNKSEAFKTGGGWQVKKFADTLKNITCLLIGCTREQLEDHTFKNTPLSEEWDCFVTTSSYGAAPELSTKNTLPTVHTSLRKMTPRLLMQLLGTESTREIIHPDIWPITLFKDYKPLHSAQVVWVDFSGKDPIMPASPEFHTYPNWIISDMRFPNELEAVKKRSGISIRINRYCYDSAENFLVCNPNKELSKLGTSLVMNEAPLSTIESTAKFHGYVPLKEQHFSETALDKNTFDFVIKNNGSIEDLVEDVKDILITLKLI